MASVEPAIGKEWIKKILILLLYVIVETIFSTYNIIVDITQDTIREKKIR